MARKRQLQLPGVVRRERQKPMPRARRDFNDVEFRRAVERNGFRQVGDLHFVDASSNRWTYVEAVCRTDPIRIARRATLAKLIRSRNGGAP